MYWLVCSHWLHISYYLQLLDMKYLIIAFVLLSLAVNAQESKQFIVDGKVKNKLIIDLNALKQYKAVSMDSLTIYNHLMERKSSISDIRGVLLKDLLSKVEIIAESPKQLSEYYLVCTAVDNYKVVFSWNEVFNSKKGDILILSSFNTNPVKTEKGDIAMISTGDEATGRRFVKGLSKISILQIN